MVDRGGVDGGEKQKWGKLKSGLNNEANWMMEGELVVDGAKYRQGARVLTEHDGGCVQRDAEHGDRDGRAPQE